MTIPVRRKRDQWRRLKEKEKDAFKGDNLRKPPSTWPGGEKPSKKGGQRAKKRRHTSSLEDNEKNHRERPRSARGKQAGCRKTSLHQTQKKGMQPYKKSVGPVKGESGGTKNTVSRRSVKKRIKSLRKKRQTKIKQRTGSKRTSSALGADEKEGSDQGKSAWRWR